MLPRLFPLHRLLLPGSSLGNPKETLRYWALGFSLRSFPSHSSSPSTLRFTRFWCENRIWINIYIYIYIYISGWPTRFWCENRIWIRIAVNVVLIKFTRPCTHLPRQLGLSRHIYIYVCIYIFIYLFMYLFMYLFIHLFIYLCVHLFIYLYLYIYIYIFNTPSTHFWSAPHMCMNVYIYIPVIYSYIRTYMYIPKYLCIYILNY